VNTSHPFGPDERSPFAHSRDNQLGLHAGLAAQAAEHALLERDVVAEQRRPESPVQAPHEDARAAHGEQPVTTTCRGEKVEVKLTGIPTRSRSGRESSAARAAQTAPCWERRAKSSYVTMTTARACPTAIVNAKECPVDVKRSTRSLGRRGRTTRVEIPKGR
jgi:hypothetical protein